MLSLAIIQFIAIFIEWMRVFYGKKQKTTPQGVV